MDKKILYQDGKYNIRKHFGIPKEAIDFFESIAWGNEGAVYENKNTKNHIPLIHNPTLFAIHEGEEIQGTALFCNTPVIADNQEFNCFYIKYFATSTAIRGKGVMKKVSKVVMQLIKDDEKQKTIYFACIERANKGSYKVVESAGYENVGTIKTSGFSRFFPKKSKNVAQVTTEEEQKKVISLLQNTYKRHALVQFNSIFLDDDYYVIRENGEIVAGCQYHRAHWVINKMSGWDGKIIMNVVPYIPLLNELFNPRKFEFLAFEGIYFKEGYEDKLHEIFEHLLAKEQLKSSMFWMAKDCPIRQKLMSKGKLGLIHEFVKANDVYVLASFQHMEESEIDLVRKNPLYASGFDYV